MRKLLSLLLLALCPAITLAGSSISLYTDSAPNVYGSSHYDPWQADTFSSIIDGTFQNMQNGINPLNVGTTNFEIQDEVVYSFGDLGKRLYWIYNIEGETKASVAGRLSIQLENVWDGESLDFYDYYYGESWIEPTKLYDYDADGNGTIDGVIGLAGMAWVPGTTQESVDAAYASWGLSKETWEFTVKLDNTECSITSYRGVTPAVPAPGAILLAGLGSMICGKLRRR